MKKTTGLSILLLTFILAAGAQGQDRRDEPLKVLFIGNSYTGVNDLPATVAALAEAAGGRRIDTGRHLVGGCTFERHVKETKAIDKIQSEKWDIVVLQEQSLRPIVDRRRMHEFGAVLCSQADEQGAEVMFYLTWARQHIPEMQEGADPVTSPEYSRSMFQMSGASKTLEFDTWCKQQEAGLKGGLNGAYRDLAASQGARIGPVGVAWKEAIAAEPPFALHRSDKSHPNPHGTYLAACVFYAELLHQSPVGLPGDITKDGKVRMSIPQSEAKRLQEIAWEVVKKQERKVPRPD